MEYGVIFEENPLVGLDNILNKMKPKEQLDSKNLSEMTKIYEKSIIESYLSRYGDHVEGKVKTAQKLGISMATLYRKLD